MRIFILDDHRLVAEALAGRLGEESEMDVVGLATYVDDAHDQIHKTKPDLVVTDLLVGNALTFDTIRHIRAPMPGVRIVILTSDLRDWYLDELLALKVNAYILKPSSTSRLRISSGAAMPAGQPLETIPT